MAEKAGWRRRYWRRNDSPPVVDVDPNVVIEDDDDAVVVEREIIVVPLRPSSCGQYRYWNGNRCVDARYNDPYLGSR